MKCFDGSRSLLKLFLRQFAFAVYLFSVDCLTDTGLIEHKTDCGRDRRRPDHERGDQGKESRGVPFVIAHKDRQHLTFLFTGAGPQNQKLRTAHAPN
jgi:hypothetical protein